jgi:16S rRNA (uracil1498-N3)-methyltransferase
MIRLFVTQELSRKKEVLITEKDHHYLCNVMRSKVGDLLVLVNGKDGVWQSEIIEITKKEVIAQTNNCLQPFSKPPFLGLVFSPIQKLDLLCKEAVELGVTEFQPIYSEYMHKSKMKLDKLKASVKEAVEQSERTDFPDINNIIRINEFFGKINEYDLVLFCEERSGANNAFEVLMNLRNKQIRLGDRAKIYVLIGAEGGFSQIEKAFIKKCPQTISVSLGERILRTETTVASALSLVNCFLL